MYTVSMHAAYYMYMLEYTVESRFWGDYTEKQKCKIYDTCTIYRVHRMYFFPFD